MKFSTIPYSYNYYWLVGLVSSIELIISTVYALYLYNRIFFGYTNSYLVLTRQINLLEFYPLIILVIFIILFGLDPNLIINSLYLYAIKH